MRSQENPKSPSDNVEKNGWYYGKENKFGNCHLSQSAMRINKFYDFRIGDDNIYAD